MRCELHPDYQAVRPPTSTAEGCTCAEVYTAAHPGLDAFAAGEEATKEAEATAKRVARLEDDLRLARSQRDAAEKRMHEAERIRETVFGLVDTPLTPPDWAVEKSQAGDAPHVAVLLASDFQFGEVIDRENMDGINEFNVSIAQERYRTLIDKTIDISLQHLPRNRYAGVHYLRLGDMVSGDIHQELRETNETGGVTSLPLLVEMETWGLRQLADAFGRVHVVNTPGNHGRTTFKPPSKRVEENYDWLSACWLQSVLRDDERVTWQVPRSTDAVFEVFGRKYLATHGDNIGTGGGQGFVGPAAPIHRGATLTLREYAMRHQHVEKMFIGHFHTALDFGRGWSNGSLPGYSEYARRGRMTPEPAQQWLVMLHPKWGDTSQWKVRVDQPEVWQ